MHIEFVYEKKETSPKHGKCFINMNFNCRRYAILKSLHIKRQFVSPFIPGSVCYFRFLRVRLQAKFGTKEHRKRNEMLLRIKDVCEGYTAPVKGLTARRGSGATLLLLPRLARTVTSPQAATWQQLQYRTCAQNSLIILQKINASTLSWSYLNFITWPLKTHTSRERTLYDYISNITRFALYPPEWM